MIAAQIAILVLQVILVWCLGNELGFRLGDLLK